MHVFMATLSTETNTFSPIPTGLADFQQRDGSVKNLGQPACRSQVDQPG